MWYIYVCLNIYNIYIIYIYIYIYIYNKYCIKGKTKEIK